MMINTNQNRRQFWQITVLIAGFLFLPGIPVLAEQRVEIREYQGTKLGSGEDFRENSIRGVQKVDTKNYRLVIDGLTARKLSLSYDELQKKGHLKKLVTLHCVEGWSVTALWEGIPLPDLLALAGPLPRAVTIIFHSVDGYTTSIPLQRVQEKNLIIADRINGMVLPSAQGYPFIFVAEEKWGYKWARWISRIELSGDPSYRGYWESRGYNTKGDLQGPIFEP